MAAPFGLALGGGAARGFAHVGVYKVLQEHHFTPMCVSGSSMGGLIGALIAAGHSAEKLQEIVSEFSVTRFLDFSLGSDMLKSSSLETWLGQYLPSSFEELQLPLTLTATDLIQGRQIFFSKGSLYFAIRATISYPGMIDPVRYQDTLLADGGILNLVPIDAARFMGAIKVIAVDTIGHEALDLPQPNTEKQTFWERFFKPRERLGALNTARRALEVMQNQITTLRYTLYPPDILLVPRLPEVGLEHFFRIKEAISGGEECAREHLDDILHLLQNEGTAAF